MNTETTNISFKCLEITQPIGKFYIGSMDYKDLLFISYSDALRIEKRDVERYLGIERPLSPQRVDSLKKYVNTIDATFPTSIILAMSSDDAEYDANTQLMKIRKNHKVGKILDGQHRIAGLSGYRGDHGEKFDINVTIFIDMDIEDQGMVFAVINLEQTKVSKSIVYSLYEYATCRSPQKTCHNIAKLLNNKEKGPFQNKIKILGSATGNAKESLTQATFVEKLMLYISREPMMDRDVLRRGNKLEMVSGTEERKLIFRNMFVQESDAEIAKVVSNYFAAVEYKWHEAWYLSHVGNILNRTTGFGALMRFLRIAYLHCGDPGDVVSPDAFAKIFAKVELKSDEFTPDNFKPGATGERDLYNLFCTQTDLHEE